MSIANRIAALNLNQVALVPEGAPQRPLNSQSRRPITPPKPQLPPRAKSTGIRVEQPEGEAVQGKALLGGTRSRDVTLPDTGAPSGNEPAYQPKTPVHSSNVIPSQKQSSSARPALPPRTSSNALVQKPPAKSSLLSQTKPPTPPRFPSRPLTKDIVTNDNVHDVKLNDPVVSSIRNSNVRKDKTPNVTRSPLTLGMNQDVRVTSGLSTRTTVVEEPHQSLKVPPPIPLSSRPRLPLSTHTETQCTQQTTNHASSTSVHTPKSKNADSCLFCRDLSIPDAHAARFARSVLPNQDLAWLSHALTSPFPSATDKARVIFTWLHHNVAYDTVAFFSGNLYPSTPASTFSSGLAVCQGYAELFSCLAMHAGLDCLVISGHGTGFGIVPLQPGQPIPAYSSNHAWNVVQIDNGEWKLIDACWGAGNVTEQHTYEKMFKDEFFTMSNEDFGVKHYPTDQDMFFRGDGKVPPWRDYILGILDGDGQPGEVVQVYTAASQEGLSTTSFSPRRRHISLSSLRQTNQEGYVQFRFSRVCPHYDPIALGRPPSYTYALCFNTGDRDPMPIHLASDKPGEWRYAIDLPASYLKVGMTVTIFAMSKIAGREGRGMSVKKAERLLRMKQGWASSAGIARWDVVA